MAGSTIPIRPLDLTKASAEDWTAFHEFRRARHAESRTDDPLRPDKAIEGQERDPSRFYRAVGWAAWDDGRIVGYVQAQLPDADRPELAALASRLSVFGSVRQDWRRRGIGTRLLDQIRALMAEAGRTVLALTTEEADGHAFLSRIGADEVKRHAWSRLTLDSVDWRLVEGWRAALPADLTATIHPGRVPLAEFARLLPAINAAIQDIPGEWTSTPAVPCTIAMIEDWYRQLDQRRGEHHMLVVKDAGGAMAAMADLTWFPDTPDRAGQNFTGVRLNRRGQGVGKAVKAATLLHVRAALPAVRLLTTGNNEVNAPMLAINRQLGFTPHFASIGWEIGLEALSTLPAD